MESGTPGRKATADGWMNRLLGVLPGVAVAEPAAEHWACDAADPVRSCRRSQYLDRVRRRDAPDAARPAGRRRRVRRVCTRRSTRFGRAYADRRSGTPRSDGRRSRRHEMQVGRPRRAAAERFSRTMPRASRA